jgi:hypothetical protein
MAMYHKTVRALAFNVRVSIWNSILKFFQVDQTGRCRMTSSARYFKFGSENYHAAGNKFRVFVGVDHSRQIIHRRVGLRRILLYGSGLHLRRSAWRAPSAPRAMPGGLPSSPAAGVRVRLGRAPSGARCGEAPVGSVLIY